MATRFSLDEGRKLIEAELRPGEEIMWLGTPNPREQPPVSLALCMTFGTGCF